MPRLVLADRMANTCSNTAVRDDGGPHTTTHEGSSGRPADHPRCARAQPQGRLPRPAARRLDRLHRPVRLGQVQPRLRHDLRRGPAAVRRVAVGVRPPVPRPDGQAGRGLHRGPVARGVHRPEVDLAEPPLDGRHDHRGLRLPPAALRARWPAALSRCAAADRPADPAADRRPGARARGGRAGSRCSRRWSAAARASTSSCSASCRPRASPGSGSTARPLAHRAAEAGQAEEAHDRGGRRPARRQGVRQAAAHRLGGDRARPVRRPGHASTSSTWPRTTSTASGRSPSTSPASTTTCPSRSSSRGRSRSTRPSAPAPSATASAPGWRSTPSWCRRPDRDARRGRDRRPGPAPTSFDYFTRLLDALGDELGLRPEHALGGPPGQGPEVDPRRAPDQGARAAPQPLRPGALLLHHLRGGPPVHRASAP